MSETAIYLLYADDGATFIYAGDDLSEYERLSSRLAADHVGSLLGRRSVGPERWVVRCYFRFEPDAQFIARRRDGFPFGLTWEPGGPALHQAADD